MARSPRSKLDSSTHEAAIGRSADADGSFRIARRREPYLIAPRLARPGGVSGGVSGGVPAGRALAEQLAALPDVEMIELLTPRPGGPTQDADRPDDAALAAHGVVVARMSPRRAEALRHEAAGQLLVEPDLALTCASFGPELPEIHDPGVAIPHGAGFATGVTVRGGGAPIAGAVVQLFGRIWSARGITDTDGHVELTIHGETPDSIAGLLVQPRAGYWSRWVRRPALAPDRSHAVELTALTQPFAEAARSASLGWGQRAMGLDRLPASWRGHGVKIALIDSGVAPSHRDLGAIRHGIDLVGRREQGWHDDETGHGSHSAGIIAGRGDDRASGGIPIRGFAPDAELHVCRLFPGGRLSDLIRALDYCLAHGIDLVNLGAGSPQGSQIVEHRILLAKQRGIACIAAAGNSAGPVEYPAASPHVLAVAALGQAGTYPSDSYHATQSIDGQEGAASGGLFAARFGCQGPEIDLVAPGIAVISSVPPDDVAARDGSSAAAAHVTGLAALLLAHHPDFRGAYAAPGAARVERLFQILKSTAVRLELGDPARLGAGLPDAARAFNLGPAGVFGGAPDSAALALLGLRETMRRAGLLDGESESADDDGLEPGEANRFAAQEPVLRGPAITSTGPLGWAPPATNGSAATLTLDGLRAAMAEAALLP
jgi:subtilisin family serine protease